MIVAATASADETRSLAYAVASLVTPGDVLLLGGDLGAGKTTFTQGFGLGLGVKEHVTSPTFTLVRPYESGPGRPSLLHVDVYRLDQLIEVLDLGLAEQVEDGAVAVVEWGIDAAPAFGPDHLEIEIALGSSDEARVLTLRPVGRRWQSRADALRRVLATWLEAA
ncbi:MAG TPA: tRNA (adenosine(37)-N6)-threonylcarbamoyltransferase complex ATPase subunit type 1 TsaE [Thermoleophilia bacterium]|nr:tRNA (adenosine(37)-N6)-threonylcarbamoyltransferase complex ATPase subunit type 1 TsaE [Thermoleophilia bacterium]